MQDFTITPLVIIGWLATGALTAFLAQRRGREPLWWFAGGMALGLFGIIVLYFMEDLSKEEKVVEKQEKPASMEKKEESNTAPKGGHWFYLDSDHKQQGPVSPERLATLMEEEEEVTTNSYVWSEGMAEWKRWDELPDPDESQ